MKSGHSAVEIRCQTIARFGYAILLLGFCGCAHLATVKTKPTQPLKTLAAESSPESARSHLTAAEREPPLGALGDDLLAAKMSYNRLIERPDDPSAQKAYNFAVARTVQNIERASLRPWQRPTNVITREGDYILSCPKPVDSAHDPSRYDLIPTDTLNIGGTFFQTPSTRNGVGAPLVAVERGEN